MTTATTNAGYVVKAAREVLKVSTADLARVAGIRRPSLESIEKGNRAATATERLAIIAGILWIAKNGVRA